MFVMKYFLINKKSVLVVVIIAISLVANAQQQPMYSQYMFNMLNINPACAGATEVPTVTALYRNQWVDMPGAPQNTSVTFDMPIESKKIGFGVQLYDERLGIEKSTGFNLFYAFRIPVSEKGTLSMGLQFGVFNYRANYTQVATFQTNDPAFSQNINGILPAAATGIYYNTDKFYIGFSTPALLKTKVSVDNTALVSSTTGSDLHLYLASGYKIVVNEDLIWNPSILLKAVGGAPLECDFNTTVLLDKILSLGLSYRTGDSWVGMVELQLNKKLQLGYAYDKTITSLATYNRGSHELMLRFRLNTFASKAPLSN
jgi:type IX secretion system PorP/SprF family membrane protein